LSSGSHFPRSYTTHCCAGCNRRTGSTLMCPEPALSFPTNQTQGSSPFQPSRTMQADTTITNTTIRLCAILLSCNSYEVAPVTRAVSAPKQPSHPAERRDETEPGLAAYTIHKRNQFSAACQPCRLTRSLEPITPFSATRLL
jgi:hypothetical protein